MLKRKESKKLLRANGSEPKKKLLLRKRKQEKSSLRRVWLNSTQLRRKTLQLKMLDLKQEELRECIKEHLKPREELMLSIKSNLLSRSITERSKCKIYLKLLKGRKLKQKSSDYS